MFDDIYGSVLVAENPYDVADQWLLNEELPMAYRQQVVEFILQNTGQQQPSIPQFDPSFADPYTGCESLGHALENPNRSVRLSGPHWFSNTSRRPHEMTLNNTLCSSSSGMNFSISL